MTRQNTIKTIAIYIAIAGGIGIFGSQNALAALPIQHWTQANGAQVWLVESMAIPMVDVQVDFDAGSRRDPAAQAGLSGVMADMLAKGTQATPGNAAEPALDENQIGEAWADLGASFGASASTDRLSMGLRSLTYPDLLPKAVALAARQLALPAFPDAVWQRERQRLTAAIQEANTRPATVANRAFAKAVYGNHPYGQETTEASLAAIVVDDMRALHASAVQACRAKVSIVGALTREQAQTLVTALLARLPAAQNCVPFPAVPEVQALTDASEQAIAFDSAQAHVFIGQPGYQRTDPDHFALTVGNYILGGGGFVSRLSSEVREKRGLSYSVYSYFAPALHAGAFTIGLQTRPDQAAQAVQVVRDVLGGFMDSGPTEVELKAAKDNLVGGFALRIDSNRKLLDNVASIAWNGLPLDYLDTWTDKVAKVTVADIRAAFARKLQPARMATVVVGPQR